MLRCPHCAHTNVRRSRSQWNKFLWSLLLLRRYKCRVCLSYFVRPIWKDDGLPDEEQPDEQERESPAPTQ
jgi:hypothetical protein